MLRQDGEVDSLNCELVGGYFGGSSQAVFTVGSLCYMGDGLYLRILDVSDPSNPVSIGRIKCPATIKEMQVVDTVAYFLDDNGDFHIMDITDPINPERVGYYDTEIYFRNFYVVDTLVYLAGGEDGFSIISLSDLAVPVEIFHNTEGVANHIQVVDSLAYVAGGEEGLRIIKISDPTNPVEIGYYDEASGSIVYVVDTLAYFGSCHIVNVADPGNPLKFGEYQCGYSGKRVIQVVDSLLYLRDGYGHFFILNVSDPTNTFRIVLFSLGVMNFHVVDSLVYAVCNYNGLHIFNVSDPTSPVEIGRYDTWNPPSGIQVIDNLAYVADGSDGLRIVNVSDPTNPVEIGHDTAGIAVYAQIVDSIAYVAGGEEGLRIIKISDPTQPVEIARYGTRYEAKYVHVVDSLAYLVDYVIGFSHEVQSTTFSGYLQVVSVSDPANPVRIIRYNNSRLRDRALSVYVVDSLAYVVCPLEGTFGYEASGLRILNVSDPTNAQEVGFYERTREGYYINGIDVVGSLVYLGVGGLSPYLGLHVIDLSDPVIPVEIGFSHTGHGVRDVQVVDGLAYVATGSLAGLRMIDVSDPTDPEEIGFYEIIGGANDVYVVGDLAYVATDENGLYIIMCKNEGDIPGKGVSPVSIDSGINIQYLLLKSERVSVEIYNVLGQKMKKLIDEVSPPGEYNLRWEGNEGIYFVIIEIGDKIYRKKAIIIR